MEEKLKQQGKNNICPIAFLVKENKIALGFRTYKSGSVWTVPGGAVTRERQ